MITSLGSTASTDRSIHPARSGSLGTASGTSRLRVLIAAVAVLVAPLAMVVGAVPAAAAAAATSYVRLAHLSPDTPQVDVWLTSFRGGSFSKVLRGVGYGALSPYERVAPGRYTISMRKPGAASDSPPLLSTNVSVKAGHSYTVAGVGPNKSVGLRVLDDDVSRPSPGKARLRVVQAASVAPRVDVSTTSGLRIATGAKFPSTTPYVEVPAQRWTLRVDPAGGGAGIEQSVDVTAGSIFTALVLDAKGGKGLQLVVRKDAAGANRMPAGSVAAGQGGAAERTGRPALPVWTLAALMLALGLGVAALVTVQPARVARAGRSVWSLRSARVARR